jgi:hypothetical protein
VPWGNETISLTLLLQISTTALILAGYGVLTFLSHHKADRTSDCWMLILGSFTFAHHPTVTDLPTLVDKPAAVIESNPGLRTFSLQLDDFKKRGTLPQLATAVQAGWRSKVASLVLAPLFALVIGLIMLEQRRARLPLIQHTTVRMSMFGYCIFLLGIEILAAVVIAHSMFQRHAEALWEIALVGLLALSVCSILAAVVVITLNQRDWKEYWATRLVEVMAAASHGGNDDRFNRAIILSNHVTSQPNVPLPGGIALYTAVYSAVQVGILALSRSLALS